MSVSQLRPADTLPMQAKGGQYVHCPYCLIGGVFLPIQRDAAGGVKATDLTPKTCDTCGRLFRLAWEVRFLGVQLENTP